MEFTFDPSKSAKNLVNHGIDFNQAKLAWMDLEAVTIQARTEGEERFAKIAKIEGKIWTVIFTKRNGAVRIISARRARQKEQEIYNG